MISDLRWLMQEDLAQVIKETIINNNVEVKFKLLKCCSDAKKLQIAGGVGSRSERSGGWNHQVCRETIERN